MILQTAKQLNNWINTQFTVVFTDHGWLEFPIEVSVNGRTVKNMHRIVFLTLSLRGNEQDCVKEIYDTLTKNISEEDLQDCCHLVLIRTSFVYRDETIYGRVAFWNEENNKQLLVSNAYTQDGGLPREARRP